MPIGLRRAKVGMTRGLHAVLPHGVALLGLGEAGEPTASGDGTGDREAIDRRRRVQRRLVAVGGRRRAVGRRAVRQHARPGLGELLQLPVVIVQRHAVAQHDTVLVTGDGGRRYTGRQYHGALRTGGDGGRVTIRDRRRVLGEIGDGRAAAPIPLHGAAESLLIAQSEVLLDGAARVIPAGGVLDAVAQLVPRGGLHVGEERVHVLRRAVVGVRGRRGRVLLAYRREAAVVRRVVRDGGLVARIRAGVPATRDGGKKEYSRLKSRFAEGRARSGG